MTGYRWRDPARLTPHTHQLLELLLAAPPGCEWVNCTWQRPELTPREEQAMRYRNMREVRRCQQGEPS